MGIIKKILGAVLGLLAAIGGLLGIGGKAKDGYFLDLSQDQASGKAQAAPAPTQAEMPKAAQGVTAQEMKAAIKEMKVEAKAKIDDAQQELVAEAAVADGQAADSTNVSFADIMMVPSQTMASRRPGPSLAGFQDMAKAMAPKR